MRKLSRLSNLCWVSSVSQPDLTATVTTVSPANSLPTSRASSPVPPSISTRGSYTMSPGVSPMGSSNSIQSGHVAMGVTQMGSNSSIQSSNNGSTCIPNMGSNNGIAFGHYVTSAGSGVPRTCSGVRSPNHHSLGNSSVFTQQASPFGSANSVNNGVSQFGSGKDMYNPGTSYGSSNNMVNPMYTQEVDSNQYMMRNENFQYKETDTQPVNICSMVNNQHPMNYNINSVGNQIGFAQNLVYLTEDGTILPVMNYSDPSTNSYYGQTVNNTLQTAVDPYQQQTNCNNTNNDVNDHTSRRRKSLLYRVQRRSISPKPDVSEQFKPCAVIPPNSIIDYDSRGTAKPPEVNFNSQRMEKSCDQEQQYPQQLKSDVGTTCDDLESSSNKTTSATPQPYPFVVETCQICNVFSPAPLTNNMKIDNSHNNNNRSNNNIIPYYSYTPCMYGNQLVLLNNENGQQVVVQEAPGYSPAQMTCQVVNDGQPIVRNSSSNEVQVLERCTAGKNKR